MFVPAPLVKLSLTVEQHVLLHSPNAQLANTMTGPTHADHVPRTVQLVTTQATAPHVKHHLLQIHPRQADVAATQPPPSSMEFV